MGREWIVPPKPKPGRKPAVDTPPTKRKAQNRNAQRNFRARNAAKVSELEDKIKANEEEFQKDQEKLMARVKQLEHSLEDCTEKLMYWRGKYSEVEDAYGREGELRQSAEMQVEILRKGMTSGVEAVALPPRRPVHNGYMAEPAPGMSNSTPEIELSAMGCGNCTAETRCECIEEAFKMDNVVAEPDAPTFKRPHSPQSDSDNKRHQLSNPDTSLEIDFTAQFSTRRPPLFITSASTSSSVAATAIPDPCGFCSDGTTCLCAELAKERPDRSLKPPASTLPTPPESGSINTSTSNPCINGPGSCAQCRSNPTSTLFCKSLAATKAFNPYPLVPTTRDNTDPATSRGSTLNCADAFTVISRHPGFDQAMSDLDTWLPQLSTIPSATTAYDIEAASVMRTIKGFDRRFGNTSKSKARDPKEISIEQHGGILARASQGEEGAEDFDEIRDCGQVNPVGKQDTKGDEWIAYAPDLQAKEKP